MFFLQLCHLLHRLWELLQGIYIYTLIALAPPSFNRGPRALCSQMTTAPIIEQPLKCPRWPRIMRTADDLQCQHISARKPTKTWPPETGEAPFACPLKWCSSTTFTKIEAVGHFTTKLRSLWGKMMIKSERSGDHNLWPNALETKHFSIFNPFGLWNHKFITERWIKRFFVDA